MDVTRIDGIDTTTAPKVVAETGPDLSRFPTVEHFTPSCVGAWLDVCPGTRISGGKRPAEDGRNDK